MSAKKPKYRAEKSYFKGRKGETASDLEKLDRAENNVMV
jgi:hypothetical protein